MQRTELSDLPAGDGETQVTSRIYLTSLNGHPWGGGGMQEGVLLNPYKLRRPILGYSVSLGLHDFHRTVK